MLKDNSCLMKKAVSSLVAFLKKKKDDFILLRDSKPSDSSENLVDQENCEDAEKFSVLRTCQRCVLIHENKTRNGHALYSFRQKNKHSFDPRASRIQPRVENYDIRLFFDVFCPNQRRLLDKTSDQASALLTVISDHVLKAGAPFSEELQIGAHYPVVIWLRSGKEKNTKEEKPRIFEEEDLIMVKLCYNDKLPSATLPAQLPARASSTSVMLWLLLNKFPKQQITLEMEEELMIGYLEDIFEVAFLHITSSAKERLAKIDALFQAVDEILEISAHAINCREDTENALTVRDVIIETATVVTSTAAESTATVGIETAAMALGQAAAGIAISVLVDIALTAGSVARAKIQRDKGKISNSQFKSHVRRKLCDSGCQFIGGTTGTIVGQVLIPVPVVGALLGGFFGSLIGVGVSKGIIKTSELIAKAQSAKAKAITEG